MSWIEMEGYGDRAGWGCSFQNVRDKLFLLYPFQFPETIQLEVKSGKIKKKLKKYTTLRKERKYIVHLSQLSLKKKKKKLWWKINLNFFFQICFTLLFCKYSLPWVWTKFITNNKSPELDLYIIVAWIGVVQRRCKVLRYCFLVQFHKWCWWTMNNISIITTAATTWDCFSVFNMEKEDEKFC